MVFRDTPSRREISRIGTCSRLCHRRIMLKNAMSNTPVAPAWSRQGSVQTWVNSQWKNPASQGQFSVEINRMKDLQLRVPHRDKGMALDRRAGRQRRKIRIPRELVR